MAKGIDTRQSGVARVEDTITRAAKSLLVEVAVPVQIKGRNGQLSGESGMHDTVGPMKSEKAKLSGSIDHGAFSQIALSGVLPRYQGLWAAQGAQ